MWQLLTPLRNSKRGCLRHQKTVAVSWKYRAFCPERGLLGYIYCGTSITVPSNIPSPWNLIVCVVNLLEQFLAVHRYGLGGSTAQIPFPAACLPAATVILWRWFIPCQMLRTVLWVFSPAQRMWPLHPESSEPAGEKWGQTKKFISDFLLVTTDFFSGSQISKK